jgi:two-component system, NtrC family, response regulator HydG
MNITRILVVDDDVAVWRIVHRMLSGDEYEVHTSNSVANALKLVEQESFDVYMLDYKLPDGSGLDIAGRIRTKWGSPPIILISGYNPSAVRFRAQQLHITEFIQKPFSRETLCEVVKKVIDASSSTDPDDNKKPLLVTFIPRLDDGSQLPWKD